MIENFLRPPGGLVEYVADALRVAGMVGVAMAAALFGLTDAGILAFVLPGVMAPRFLGLRPWPDVVTSVTLLVAAWSNVADLYRTVPWWDIPVHALCAGVVAALVHDALARFRVVPDPLDEGAPKAGTVALTGMLGLSVGALWEVVEWIGYEFVTEAIHVTYADTISDLVAGGVGALVAGMFLVSRPLRREQSAGRDA